MLILVAIGWFILGACVGASLAYNDAADRLRKLREELGGAAR